MQGASRASLAALRDVLAEQTTSADAATLAKVSDALFAVVTLLVGQGSLRRTLSDPAIEPDAKARVVDSLLAERIDPAALEVVRGVALLRWSEPGDVVDALEALAVEAALQQAESEGVLDEVEDELFRFERILNAEADLRAALTDQSLPDDRKRDLLHRLLDDKVNDVTFGLLERAVLTPRGRTIERVITDLSALAAKRRERLIARVTTAVELNEQEYRDLAAALHANFGSDIQLQVVVDASLIGGLTVRIGDELIDGSVARQLAEARRRLTSRPGSGPRRT
jgi:F-type H+-transporting ATPase subunit delta